MCPWFPIRSRPAGAALADALDVADPDLRAEAVKALAESDTAAADEALERALEDEDETVRSLAQDEIEARRGRRE